MRVNEQNGDLGLLVCFATNASAIYFTKEQYVVFTVCDGGLLLLFFFLFYFFLIFSDHIHNDRARNRNRT